MIHIRSTRPITDARRARRRVRAYTLVELTVSAAITTVLLGSVGSALLISSYALPSRQSVFAQTTSAAPALEQIAADLQYAVHVPLRQASAITVIVPDRDGDGHNERIQYDWSGTAGAPLRRTYNGGTTVTLLPRVADFQINYQTTSVPEEYPGPPVEDAADSVLFEYVDTSSTSLEPISTTQYVAQTFSPAAPSMATEWRATQIRLHSQQRATLAGTWLRLFAVDDSGKPTGAALWSTLIWGNSGSADWTQAGFLPAAPKLPIHDTYCMVIESTLGTTIDLSVNDKKSDGLLTTDDDGANWNVHDDGAALCKIIGRITQPDGVHSVTRQHLTRIRLGLQTGGEAVTRLETAAWTLNAPELLAAFWTMSFWDGDPTAQDHNGDGVVDWITANGMSMNTGTDLVAGNWTPSLDLLTHPPNAFNGNTTIELSLRDTGSDPGRAHLSVNLENSGTQAAPISVFAMLQPDGTQTLEIYNSDAVVMKDTAGVITIDGTLPSVVYAPLALHPVAAVGPLMVVGQVAAASAAESAVAAAVATPLVRISDLPPEPIEVRLIANTAQDDLVLFIGGRHYGTYTYQRYTMSSPVSRVLVGGNDTSEYQYVRIRVSP